MEGMGKVLIAAVAWTVALALAVVATAAHSGELRMWAILTALIAHLFTVWMLPYPVVERVVREVVKEAMTEIRADNKRVIEEVAEQMVAELTRDPEVTPLRR